MYKRTNHILCKFTIITFMKCRCQSGRGWLFLEMIRKRIHEDVLTAKSNHPDTYPRDSAPPWTPAPSLPRWRRRSSLPHLRVFCPQSRKESVCQSLSRKFWQSQVQWLLCLYPDCRSLLHGRLGRQSNNNKLINCYNYLYIYLFKSCNMTLGNVHDMNVISAPSTIFGVKISSIDEQLK